MKKSRFTATRIIAILLQAEGGVPVADLCREIAVETLARNGVSIAFACWTFGVRERYFRKRRKLKPENERIGELLSWA